MFAVKPWPFIKTTDSGLVQPLEIVWSRTDASPSENVDIDGIQYLASWQERADGSRQCLVYIALIEDSRDVVVSVSGESLKYSINPPRRWELYLVPHSHQDIGYTEFPDLVADAHGDFIAEALDIMSATDHLDDNAKFRWTCEATWSVEQFVRRHPHRVDEFVRRIHEGRMELTALYGHMTDLCGEEAWSRCTAFARVFSNKHRVPKVTACQYDINGFPLGLPKILNDVGVRYLDTAINAVRALPVKPCPAPYRWMSPDGSEVLLWHSLGYLAGNDCNLHVSFRSSEPRLAELLDRMTAEDYPHYGLQLQISGVTGDNMPPNRGVCDVVSEWNQTWAWPKLRICTAREWFEHIEANWPLEIQATKKAWPDWWCDGIGSAAVESGLARQTQARLGALQAQRAAIEASGVSLSYLDETYETAWRRSVLACEHTWGPYDSMRPYARTSQGQWHYYALNAFAADAYADRIQVEQMVALTTLGSVTARTAGLTNATLQGTPSGALATSDPPCVVAFNPGSEIRTETISVHVSGHLLDGACGNAQLVPAIVDEAGQTIPAVVSGYEHMDIVNRSNFKVEFLARDLPARGHKLYRLATRAAREPIHPEPPTDLILENPYYSIRVNRDSGGISSMVHRPTGRQIILQTTGYDLGQCIYEAPTEGRYSVAYWEGLGRNGTFERTTPDVTSTRHKTRYVDLGLKELVVHSHLDNALDLEMHITLSDSTDRVDIRFVVNKPVSDRPEALYHAFPMLSDVGQLWLSAVGGCYRPGIDQMPGTNTDWHGIQSWFAIQDSEGVAVVASPDIPLVQAYGINTGKWQSEVPSPNGLAMSWVMNNYWFTNFPLLQSAHIEYRYSITYLPGDFSMANVDQFAGNVRQPSWAYSARISPNAQKVIGAG